MIRLFRRRQFAFTHTLIVCTSLFMTMVVLLQTFFVSQQYTDALQSQNENATIASFAYSIKQIEAMLDDARMIALTAVQEPNIQDYLTGEYESALERVELFRYLIEYIMSIKSDSLNGLVFIDRRGNASGYLNKWVFSREHNQTLSAVADSISQRLFPSFHVAGAYQQTKLIESVPERYTGYYKNNLAILAAQTYSFPRASAEGDVTILLSIDENAVLELIGPANEMEGSTMLVMQDGSYVAGAGVSLAGESFEYVADIDPESESGSMLTSIDGDRYQLIYCRSADGNWMLTKLVPFSVYTAETYRLTVRTVIVSTLICAVFWALYFLWIRSFSRPFNEIAKRLRDIQKNRLDTRLSTETRIREFGIISKRFNEMAESIEALQRREREDQNEKMLLELRSLQAQINPHFIYNSIASIRWLATLSGATRVADMLIELAEAMRPVFREWSLAWPITDELSFIRHYMQLMHLRYDVTFSIDNRLPEDLAEMTMPRFTLQPILENACEHAIPSAGHLNVSLVIEAYPPYVCFEVSDNGTGIAPDALERLRGKLAGHAMEDDDRRRGIGLVNVNRRLQLIYGAGCGLSIESEPGVGTTVSMSILTAVPEMAQDLSKQKR